MSHFVSVVTEVRDPKALIRALGRMGFKNKVETYDTPQHLYGYKGDMREQKADVIIRRRYVGHASNDIGFEKTEDGRYISHISEFDQRKYNDAWQKKLYTYYGVEKSKMECDNRGLKYEEDIDEENRVRLRIHMRDYN